jgi:hypothetical protein
MHDYMDPTAAGDLDDDRLRPTTKRVREIWEKVVGQGGG